MHNPDSAALWTLFVGARRSPAEIAAFQLRCLQRLVEHVRGWGLEPIPCPFRNSNSFGGSFHCATLDVRRRGDLESYFP